MKLKLVTCSVAILFLATGCMKISKKGAEKTTSHVTVVEPLDTYVPDQGTAQTPVTVSSSKYFFDLKTDRFDYTVSSEKIDFHFPDTWPSDIYVEVTINQNKMVIPIKKWKIFEF